MRTALSCLFLAALVPLGPTVPVRAQKEKDTQSAVEPRSKPGAGQAFLAKFVGDWDVQKTFHGRSGDAVQTKGRCRQTLIHDGRFLQSDFVFEAAAGKTTGQGLIGFEPATGLFTSVWTDSRQTRMSFRQSQAPFGGDEIVLHSAALGDGKGERRSRTVTRLEDGGRRLVHRQFNATPDGQERLLMELVLTRRAP